MAQLISEVNEWSPISLKEKREMKGGNPGGDEGGTFYVLIHDIKLASIDQNMAGLDNV